MVSNKELAEMLGKDPATMSKWVTNTSLPSLDMDYQSREDKNRFIPLYSIKAACGEFSNLNDVEHEGWGDASHSRIYPEANRCFAVKACGHSMEPKISDGDICIYEWHKGGSHNGEIVLTECNEHDTNYNGSYTIKKYYSEKVPRMTDLGATPK